MNNIAGLVRMKMQQLNEAPDTLNPEDFSMDADSDKGDLGDTPEDDGGNDTDANKGDDSTPDDNGDDGGDDSDLNPEDFSMGEDDPDASDADDSVDDSSDDPDTSTEDLEDEQNNEDSSIRILQLSDLDRTLAEKKLLSDFFDLNGMLTGLIKRTEKLRPVLEAEDFNDYKDSVDELSQTLTDYIAYKFRINSLEENGKNFALFTSKINVLIDEFKASFSKKGDNK